MSTRSNDKPTYKQYSREPGTETVYGTLEISGTTIQNIKGQGISSAEFTTSRNIHVLRLVLDKNYPSVDYASFNMSQQGLTLFTPTDNTRIIVADLDVTSSSPHVDVAFLTSGSAPQSASYLNGVQSGAAGTNQFAQFQYMGLFKNYGPAV